MARLPPPPPPDHLDHRRDPVRSWRCSSSSIYLERLLPANYWTPERPTSRAPSRRQVDQRPGSCLAASPRTRRDPPAGPRSQTPPPRVRSSSARIAGVDLDLAGDQIERSLVPRRDSGAKLGQLVQRELLARAECIVGSALHQSDLLGLAHIEHPAGEQHVTGHRLADDRSPSRAMFAALSMTPRRAAGIQTSHARSRRPGDRKRPRVACQPRARHRSPRRRTGTGCSR